MTRAGFVLVGGKSSRMGRDKALLDYRGRTMTEHVAAAVALAAGSVTLIGDPERYEKLGYPVVADLIPGCGPLGGIYTALSVSAAQWNLVAACDMPGITGEFLAGLLHAAETAGGDCLMPVSPSGLPEPLCAVYRKTCLRAAEDALREGRRKTSSAFEGLRVTLLPVAEVAWFQNVNTPEERQRSLACDGPAPPLTSHD